MPVEHLFGLLRSQDRPPTIDHTSLLYTMTLKTHTPDREPSSMLTHECVLYRTLRIIDSDLPTTSIHPRTPDRGTNRSTVGSLLSRVAKRLQSRPLT